MQTKHSWHWLGREDKTVWPLFQQVVAMVSSCLWPLNKYDFIIVVVRVTCCKLPHIQCHLNLSLSLSALRWLSAGIICSLAERMNACLAAAAVRCHHNPAPHSKICCQKKRNKRKSQIDKKHLPAPWQLRPALGFAGFWTAAHKCQYHQRTRKIAAGLVASSPVSLVCVAAP